MIDLYGMSSPNVYKVVIILEETLTDYEFKYTDVFGGDQYKKEFLEISPNNKVPVIVDSDGSHGQPFPVFESGAILIYLAEKTGRFLSNDPAERSIALQWLMMQMASVGPMLGQLNHFLVHAPEINRYAVSRYTTEMQRILDVLDRRLSKARYLGGADYSIADMAVLPWMRVTLQFLPPFQGKQTLEACSSRPSLSRWYHELIERPAVQRAFLKWEAVLTKDAGVLMSAEPDDLDQYLGRGRFSRSE